MEHAASGLPNPTRLEGEVRLYPRPAGVTTRKPRMVTECLLTRSMLIKMYLPFHGMCLYMFIAITVSQFHANAHSVYLVFQVAFVWHTNSIKRHGYKFITSMNISLSLQ